MSQADRIRRDAKAVIDRLRERGHDPAEVNKLHRLWVASVNSAGLNRSLHAENMALREAARKGEG